MLKNVGLILAALVLTANTDAAVPRRSVPDEQIVAQAELVASGTYLEIYQHGVTIDPVFLNVMGTRVRTGAERHWVEAGHRNPRAQGSRLRALSFSRHFSSTAEMIRRLKETAFLRGPIETLGEAQREQAWAEIERQLSRLEAPSGIEVPGEFFIGAGTK
jgi:hypothetical protein